MTYEEIKKIILYQRRRDYSFPTSALKELNDVERKDIERLIIEYSLKGDTFLFDHLSSLIFYDISEVFNKDVLVSLSPDKRHDIIEILYKKTHDNTYIDYLLEMALQGDFNAFSALTLWYGDGKIDRSYYQKILDAYNMISDTNPNKVYFGRMLKRIGVVKEDELPKNEKVVLASDILEKEVLFPLRCVLRKFDGHEIPIIWNYKKSHKTVLLCLHGFGGDKDSSVIAALMEKMDAEGAGVVTFDWPAHGESNVPDYELTVENCISDLDDVIRFINGITTNEICCFATSFGGYLATLYRNSHEKAFLYLILRSPALKMAEVYRGLIADKDFEKLMRGELIEQGYERKMHLGKVFYDSLLRNDAYNTEPPMPWNIKIIQGDQDDIVDPEDIRAYAERYRDKKLKLTIFEGTDHIYKCPGEKDKIVETVADYLDHFLHEEKYDLMEVERKRQERSIYLDKIRGCLFGGAVGDALGYPIEFMKEPSIWNKYGKNGITSYEKDKKSGKVLISDDTQMTLFTANGLLVGDTRGCLRGIQGPPAGYVYDSYMDWLLTQQVAYGDKEVAKETHISWLMDVPELYARRAPGNACISALEELKYHGKNGYPDIFLKRNDSKGCGGIMRVAPLALDCSGLERLDAIDKEGADIAMITHCHSLGYMSAAVLTHILNRIVYPQNEMNLEEIIIDARDTVSRIYAEDEHLAELVKIINLAMSLSKNNDDDLTNIHRIGGGWVAEETLGIALYCALRYRDNFSAGIIASVNHNGDSDSTGAVAGNILGAINGYSEIEEKWKEDLELADVILEIADDLCFGCLMEEYSSYRDPDWERKYIQMKR